MPAQAEVLAAQAVPDLAPPPSTPIHKGWATHYGESYQGGVLGCGGGFYDTDNPNIAAIGPARYAEWPCGSRLRVCGPAGCAVVTRMDACPGCGAGVVDLSEAGNRLVCGDPPHTCRATIQLVELPAPAVPSEGQSP